MVYASLSKRGIALYTALISLPLCGVAPTLEHKALSWFSQHFTEKNLRDLIIKHAPRPLLTAEQIVFSRVNQPACEAHFKTTIYPALDGMVELHQFSSRTIAALFGLLHFHGAQQNDCWGWAFGTTYAPVDKERARLLDNFIWEDFEKESMRYSDSLARGEVPKYVSHDKDVYLAGKVAETYLYYTCCYVNRLRVTSLDDLQTYVALITAPLRNHEIMRHCNALTGKRLEPLIKSYKAAKTKLPDSDPFIDTLFSLEKPQ